MDRLGTQEKDLFQKYADVQNEVNQLTAVRSLVDGFKAGLIMTAEAFIEWKNCESLTGFGSGRLPALTGSTGQMDSGR